MIQQQSIKEILAIEVTPEEHKKIKVFSDLHGNSINEYVLDSVRDRINHESEDEDLLKITTSINPVLEELWDNDKDAVYDEL